MPPRITNKKEDRANIQKIQVRNHSSNNITIKTANIKKGIKTDSKIKIIHNSSLINKICSKWTNLNYNQFSFKFLHIMDPTCFK